MCHRLIMAGLITVGALRRCMHEGFPGRPIAVYSRTSVQVHGVWAEHPDAWVCQDRIQPDGRSCQACRNASATTQTFQILSWRRGEPPQILQEFTVESGVTAE